MPFKVFRSEYCPSLASNTRPTATQYHIVKDFFEVIIEKASQNGNDGSSFEDPISGYH